MLCYAEEVKYMSDNCRRAAIKPGMQVDIVLKRDQRIVGATDNAGEDELDTLV